MSTQHTSGPWSYEHETCGGHNLYVFYANKKAIGHFGGYEGDYAPHEIRQDEANARLIAASPELLEALQRIARMTKDGEAREDGEPYDMLYEDAYDTLHGVIDMARAAIAKAEGKQ